MVVLQKVEPRVQRDLDAIGKPQLAAVERSLGERLRAFRQAPGADDINLSLARVLYQTGNRKDAALLIARNLSASHSEEARQRYGKLLQQIKDGNVDPEFLEP